MPSHAHPRLHGTAAAALLAAATVVWACTPDETDRVVAGDVTIQTQADAARIADAVEITGKLTVKRADLDRLSLPRLRSIGGKLYVQKNPRLAALSLPALETVGTASGDVLIIERNPALAAIDLGSLTATAYQLAVRENGALRHLSLPGLAEARGLGIEITDDAALEDVSAPGLMRSAAITIRGCPGLRAAAFPILPSTAALVVEDDTRLARLDLTSLARINHGVDHSDAWIPCRLSLIGDGEIATLAGLQHLAHLGPDCQVEIRGNAALPTCETDALRTRLTASGADLGGARICDNLTDGCGGATCPAPAP